MRKRLTVIIDNRLIEALKIDAIVKASSVSEIVEKLIAQYLKIK